MSQLVHDRIPCANVKVEGDRPVNCVTPSNFSCSKCHLVMYCGRECQATHRPQHRLDCNSALREAGWQPAWVREGRKPTLESAAPSSVTLWHPRDLYGLVVAYDILNLAHNEGLTHNEDLNLCFAASGDLRNFIKSIVEIPDSYNGTALCIVNDRDQIIVARNVVMLLTSLVFPPVVAAEIMLHIWYSARLKPKMFQDVKDRVRPLIAQVLKGFEQRKHYTLLSGTWTFGSRVVSLCQCKGQWEYILMMLDTKHPVSNSEVHKQQYMKLNAPGLDTLEHRLLQMPPSWRVCIVKMRESGMLLPFGCCLGEYTCQNPTLFDIERCAKLLHGSSYPLDSWALEDILASGARHGGPGEDIYGLMYLHVRHLLETFCQKITSLKIHMDLYCRDATDLPSLLEPRLKESGFDRIDISNIAYEDYKSLETSILEFGPLLKSPASNPHATLITLFMTGANLPEEAAGFEMNTKWTNLLEMKRFLPHRFSQSDPKEPATMRPLVSKDPVRRYYELWALLREMINHPDYIEKIGLKPKMENTVVEPWPTRLQKEDGEPGSQEELDRLLESGSVKKHRFVEWVRNE